MKVKLKKGSKICEFPQSEEGYMIKSGWERVVQPAPTPAVSPVTTPNSQNPAGNPGDNAK